MAMNLSGDQGAGLITRPDEVVTPTFHFSAVNATTTRRQLKQVGKTWDFSGAAAQFDRISSVRPLFGPQAVQAAVPTQVIGPPANRPDLSALKLPLSDLLETSILGVLEDAKDDLTAISQLSVDQDRNLDKADSPITICTVVTPQSRPIPQRTVSTEPRDHVSPVNIALSTSLYKEADQQLETSSRTIQTSPAGESSRDNSGTNSKGQGPSRVECRISTQIPERRGNTPTKATKQKETSRYTSATKDRSEKSSLSLIPAAPDLTAHWASTDGWVDAGVVAQNGTTRAGPRASGTLARPSVATTNTVAHSKTDGVLRRPASANESLARCDVEPTDDKMRRMSAEVARGNSADRHEHDKRRKLSRSRPATKRSTLVVPAACVNSSLTSTECLTPVLDAPEMKVVQAMHDLRTENAMLRSCLADRDKQLSRATTDLQEQRIERQETAILLSDQRRQTESLENDHEQMQSKIHSLKLAHSKAQSTMTKISDDSHSIQQHLHAYGQKVTQFTDEICEIRRTVSANVCSLQQHADQIAGWQKHLKDLHASSDKLTLDCQDLHSASQRDAQINAEQLSRISELSASVRSLTEARDLVEQQSASALAQRDERFDILSMEVRNSCTTIQLENHNTILQLKSSLESVNLRLEGELAISRQEIADLRQVLNTQRQEHSDLEVAHQVKANSIVYMNQELDVLRARSEEDRLQRISKQAEIDEMQRSIKLLETEHQKAEVQHEARIQRCQADCKLYNQQEANRRLQECEEIRKESQDRKKIIEELESANALQLEKSRTLQREALEAEKNHARSLALAKDAQDTERASYRQQMQQVREQETMIFENQIKAQETRLNRMEIQAKEFNELTQIKSRLSAEIEAMRARIVLLQEDSTALQEIRARQADDAVALAALERQNSALRLGAKKHDELKRSHQSLERVHAESLATMNSLGAELRTLKMQAAVDDHSAAQSPGHIKDSQPNVEVASASKNDRRIRSDPQVSQFATLNVSSDSLSECEDPTVYDIVGNTPPHKSPASGLATNKKEKGKKRSLAHDIVRNTQHENGEVFPKAVGTDVHIIPRINQLREEKTTRSRSQARTTGYKKRKSN